MLFEPSQENFLHRHGNCIRDPQNERLWLFEDGAYFFESWSRGESQAVEPSQDPIARIEVQIRYLQAVYRQAWKRLNEAKATGNLERMRGQAASLKSINLKIEAKRAEFDSLPGIKEAKERQAAENAENAARLERLQIVEAERERQGRELREQANAIYDTACKETPELSPIGSEAAARQVQLAASLERSSDPITRRLESLASFRAVTDALAEFSYARMNGGR